MVDTVPLKRIRTVHLGSRQTYGTPRSTPICASGIRASASLG
ncbi:hypothetical protein ACXIT0_23580 [Methylorubrum extorquens]|nr:hypothetical protein [Methylorubrum sp. B1-46]